MVIISVNDYIYVYVHIVVVCVASVHVCGGMWRAEADVKHLFSAAVHLYFWVRVFHGKGTSSVGLGWMANGLLIPTCFTLPHSQGWGYQSGPQGLEFYVPSGDLSSVHCVCLQALYQRSKAPQLWILTIFNCLVLKDYHYDRHSSLPCHKGEKIGFKNILSPKITKALMSKPACWWNGTDIYLFLNERKGSCQSTW